MSRPKPGEVPQTPPASATLPRPTQPAPGFLPIPTVGIAPQIRVTGGAPCEATRGNTRRSPRPRDRPGAPSDEAAAPPRCRLNPRWLGSRPPAPALLCRPADSRTQALHPDEPSAPTPERTA